MCWVRGRGVHRGLQKVVVLRSAAVTLKVGELAFRHKCLAGLAGGTVIGCLVRGRGGV